MAADMSKDQLDSLKYRELQKLAKLRGLKANMPKAALIEALIQVSIQQPVSLNSSSSAALIHSDQEEGAEDGPSSADKPRRRGAFQFRPARASSPKATESNSPEAVNRTFTLEAEDNDVADQTFTVEADEDPAPADQTVIIDKSCPDQKRLVASGRSTHPDMAAPQPTDAAENVADALNETFTVETTSGEPDKPEQPKESRNVSIKETPGQKSRGASTLAASKSRSHLPTMKRKIPDFAKIHAQMFDRMDPLDIYYQKKQERMKKLLTPGKGLSCDQPGSDVAKTPIRTRSSITVAPASSAKRIKVSAEVKPQPVAKTNPARATVVLDVKEANFKFGQQQGPRSSSRQQPFVFTATPKRLASRTLTPSHSDKKTFDLKASLAKPLPYKPHQGKLKVLNGSSGTTTQGRSSLKGPKAPAASHTSQVRQKVATQIKGVRLNRRTELLMQRRHLHK